MLLYPQCLYPPGFCLCCRPVCGVGVVCAWWRCRAPVASRCGFLWVGSLRGHAGRAGGVLSVVNFSVLAVLVIAGWSAQLVVASSSPPLVAVLMRRFFVSCALGSYWRLPLGASVRECGGLAQRLSGGSHTYKEQGSSVTQLPRKETSFFWLGKLLPANRK